MRVGMIGLGRMGGNMARRLGRNGIVRARLQPRTPAAGRAGQREQRRSLEPPRRHARGAREPRVVWMMVPAGAATEENVQVLAQRDSRPATSSSTAATRTIAIPSRRGLLLEAREIGFVDAGVSGGVWGLEQGYGLMLGGAREHVDAILPSGPRAGARAGPWLGLLRSVRRRSFRRR